MSHQKLHIPSLTGIRALAAAMVFIGHVITNHFNEINPLLHYGWIGVNIFFALSGYLFFLLYADVQLDTSFSWLDYIKRRIIRIYPLTVAVVIFSSCMLWGSFSISDILSHLALLHGFSPFFRFSINPPLWSLTVEICFYLLAPLLILMLASTIDILSKRWKDLPILHSKWLMAGTLCAMWMFSVAFSRGAGAIYQNWLVYFTGVWDQSVLTTSIFGRIDDFVAGMVVAGYARAHKKNTTMNGDIIALAGIAIILAVMVFSITHGGPNQVGKHKLSDFAFPLFAMGASFVFYGMHNGGFIEKFFSSKPLMLLGETSFGLYVLHYISFPGYPKSALSLQQYFESLGIHFGLAALLCYCIFALFAYIVYRFYEKPISHYLTRRLQS